MIEFPEAITLARQLEQTVAGQVISRVLPPNKEHKFCWFTGDPKDYDGRLKGRQVTGAQGFGIFAELAFDDGQRLCVNDGVNVRLIDASAPPKAYQLVMELENGQALAYTVAMYGGICLHDGSYDNEYYQKSKSAVSPLSAGFADVFMRTLGECKGAMSAKAFLATQQRFPGLGNGVLQDILLMSRIHPKRKLSTLTSSDVETLLASTVFVLGDMTARGGRDTEKDVFGAPGGYQTKLSKNTLAGGCPLCGGQIVKEAYLGGSVYYCPNCQK